MDRMCIMRWQMQSLNGRTSTSTNSVTISAYRSRKLPLVQKWPTELDLQWMLHTTKTERHPLASKTELPQQDSRTEQTLQNSKTEQPPPDSKTVLPPPDSKTEQTLHNLRTERPPLDSRTVQPQRDSKTAHLRPGSRMELTMTTWVTLFSDGASI